MCSPVFPIPPSPRLVNLLKNMSIPAVKQPSAPFLSDVTCVKFKADGVQRRVWEQLENPNNP